MNTITDDFHHRLSRLEQKVAKRNSSPTIPKYDLHTPQLIQHYVYLREVQWDYQWTINGVDLVGGSWYQYSEPPGVTQDPYEVASAPYQPVTYKWSRYAEDKIAGMYVWSGLFQWRNWVKNIYHDGVLINTESSGSAYTGLGGSGYTIQSYAGGGNAASTGSTNAILRGVGSYGGVGVTHSIQMDVSCYNTNQDNWSNVFALSMASLPSAQQSWNPWRGYFTIGIETPDRVVTGVAPPTGRNTNGPTGWSNYYNNGMGVAAFRDPPETTSTEVWGPAVSTVMRYDQTTWYTIRWEGTLVSDQVIAWPDLTSMG